MKILNRVVSIIAILLLIMVSIIFILSPLNILEIISLKSITKYVNIISGNYLYSALGVIMFILGIKALLSGIIINRSKNNEIVTHMNFGDLRISDEAVKGLAYSVISKIIGIRESKIIVRFIESYVVILIRGQVSPDINIPDIANEIQNKVKEIVETNTGIEVRKVNVEVVSISSPMKVLK